MVFLADRHATGGDDEVMIGGSRAQHAPRLNERIAHDAEIGQLATQPLDQAVQHEAVRVVNCPGLEGFARHGQFVAGEKQGDLELAQHRENRQPDRSRQAAGLWRQQGASCQDFGAGANVFAGPPHPFTGLRHMIDRHPVAIERALLLHHHRVGARRDHGTGEYACQRARCQRLRHLPGRHSLRNRQARARRHDVGRTHGVTIHRSIVHRRHIERGAHDRSQHPAMRRERGHLLLPGNRHCLRQQGCQCFIHRQHLRAVHRQTIPKWRIMNSAIPAGSLMSRAGKALATGPSQAIATMLGSSGCNSARPSDGR